MPGACFCRETVVREQLPAVFCNERHGIQHELERRLTDEVVEVDAHPARFHTLTTALNLTLELHRGFEVDPQQPMTIWARAAAAAACLDPEQVIEKRDAEVVVEVAFTMAKYERHDGEAPCVRVAEDANVRVVSPAVDGTSDETFF